jgi:hypothetical protein
VRRFSGAHSQTKRRAPPSSNYWATGARVSFIALTDSAILAEQVGQAAATPSANGKKPGV